MKKYHFILLVFLGMFLMPSNAMACGKGSDKSSCKKEISSTKSEKKSCCDSDNSKEKDHKGCKGNCGHSKCGCSSTCPTSSVSFSSEILLKITCLAILQSRKLNFHTQHHQSLMGFISFG